MDPQGRGAASGWEYVKGLAAAGAQEELASENVKSAAASKGEAAFAIASADAATGEIAGVFVTRQVRAGWHALLPQCPLQSAACCCSDPAVALNNPCRWRS
jgi:hypothetical protein